MMLLWCLFSRHHLAPVHLYVLLFSFFFLHLFQSHWEKKQTTFTTQCLPSQMRQEKSKPMSLFPNKDLLRVSILRGDWTHRPEICSDVFSHTSPNLVLFAVCGSRSQSCLSSLQIALQHISGWMSQGHLHLRFQRVLMNRRISLLKHTVAFRLLNGCHGLALTGN